MEKQEDKLGLSAETVQVKVKVSITMQILVCVDQAGI